jgi:hypothetical protein
MGQTQQAFLMLFLISSCCRIGALILLARVTGVMAAVRRSMPVVMRLVSINPEMGSIDRPILSSMPDEQPATEPVAAGPAITVEPAHRPVVAAPAMAASVGQVS